MFELIGNVAHASTILEAIKIWSSPNSQDPDFIRTREARKVGCAIPNCVVRTVLPALTRRSYLRTLLHRAPNWLCACMASDVDGRYPCAFPFPFRRKQTHVVFFLPPAK